MTYDKKPHVVVIGAGAFGGWTALHLLRQGSRVTLVDCWGPGNARASSGGETRVLRALYGPAPIYVRMVVRSIQLWREYEAAWKRTLYHETGILWLVGNNADYDKYVNTSLPLMREAALPYEQLSVLEAVGRYPQVNFSDTKWVLLEKKAGYLTAREACEAVFDAFRSGGGEYRQLAVDPSHIASGDLQLSDGTRLRADKYVFACGPWLGKLFPELLGKLIDPTRQEVFFFGTPAGESRFSEEKLPICIDLEDRGNGAFGGYPGNSWRGFKVMSDKRGPTFDPTNGERQPTAAGLKYARDFLGFRFPALRDAPLLESEVCQYENTPDHDFIIDRHPQNSNVWIVGGGSGHGFKHGPAIGEMVGNLVLEKRSPDPFFQLARFRSKEYS